MVSTNQKAGRPTVFFGQEEMIITDYLGIGIDWRFPLPVRWKENIIVHIHKKETKGKAWIADELLY